MNKSIFAILTAAAIVILLAVGGCPDKPKMIVPPPIAVVEAPATVVNLGTIEVPKSIPKKKKSAKCSKAETEAYGWAFFNAYRANQLMARKQYLQGPNPCNKK